MNKIPLALTVIRWFVGVTFIFYGVVKLLGGQFVSGTVPDATKLDGPSLVWAFFGYSPVYGKLIGVAECVGGALLLFPRTRLLAALALFPMTANITVMDFCFDFPAVKYFSLLLTILVAVLLLADLRKLKPILWDSSPTPELVSRQTLRWLVLPALLIGLLIANVLGLAVNGNPGPTAAEHRSAAGQSSAVAKWRTESRHGIGLTGLVEFVDGGKLELTKPHGFAAWQVEK